MDFPGVVRKSVVYDVAATLFRWFEASRTATVLSNPVVLRALLASVVVLSITKVLLSRMNAATKFLSFALLFVALAFLLWGFAEPLTEG